MDRYKTVRHYRGKRTTDSSRQRDGWFLPAQKPPELMKWCIGFMRMARRSTTPTWAAGTTGIAAVRMVASNSSRVEIDAGYFDTALQA